MKALTTAAPLFLLPALSLTVAADELERGWIDPDAQVVVHFDWEGLQATQLWKEVLASEGSNVNLDDLDEFVQEFGLDPVKDVRAVTMYSLNLDESTEDDAVLLFSTTKALDGALERLSYEPGYSTARHEGLDLHVFHEDDSEDTMTGYVHATGDQRVLVVAGDAARVVRAARIVRGESPSHAKAEVPRIQLQPQKGSFLYVAAGGLSGLDGFAPTSEVFSLTRGMTLDVGEQAGSLTAHMRAVTGSPEDATNVADVLRGLKAMASLLAGESPELAEFARAVTVESRGSEVFLDFRFPLMDLIDHLETLEEEY